LNHHKTLGRSSGPDANFRHGIAQGEKANGNESAMAFEILQAVVVLLFLAGACALLYWLISSSIRSRKQAVDDRSLELEYLTFAQAKAVVIDHAEKLSRSTGMSFDDAVKVVLSGDYVPGVGVLRVPETE
jgi:hypothetical protein